MFVWLLVADIETAKIVVLFDMCKKKRVLYVLLRIFCGDQAEMGHRGSALLRRRYGFLPVLSA